MTRIEGLTTVEELQAASRSRFYQVLERAFSFPQATFYQAVRGGQFWRELLESSADLPYELALQERSDLSPAGTSVSYEDFQAEYIRLFDVGVGRPPCPLYGGAHLGGRKKVLEETVRFYNYFHLHRTQPSSELPDHITVELEFMHFLAFKEVAALHGGQDRTSYVRAQRDFLERHLARWVPKACRSLERQQPHPFFLALMSLTEEFLTRDLGHVRALLTGPSPFG